MKVLAVCNQKGGVGKTTTTFHIARAAVQSGLRVLAVDADPQGSLTSVITADPVPDEQVGLADVLSPRANEAIADVAVTGCWDGLTVVPTTGDELGWVRDELTAQSRPGKESRLRQALSSVAGDHDLTLIDCAPALDQLTINALTAADAALIVTQSKLFSSNGLARLLDTIDQVRTHYRPTLEVAGIIVNHHEARTVAGKTWLAELEDAAAARSLDILRPLIPKRVVISDATEAGRGLDEWGSAEAQEFAEIYAGYVSHLTQELGL